MNSLENIKELNSVNLEYIENIVEYINDIKEKCEIMQNENDKNYVNLLLIDCIEMCKNMNLDIDVIKRNSFDITEITNNN